MINLPTKLTPTRAQYNENLPIDIQDKRFAIVSKDVVFQVSNLQDYVSILYHQEDTNTRFSDNVPWDLNIKSVIWTGKHEICASSVLLALSYRDLATTQVLKSLDNEVLGEEDKNWKISNDWLKKSLSLINFLITKKYYDNDIELLSLGFLSFLSHMLECSVQLNLLIKINHTKLIELIASDWDFEIDTKNVLLLLKVCIFIGDELTICEKILESLPSQKNLIEHVRIHRLYIKIYIAFYSALQHYEIGSLGMGIGILDYIRTYLLKNEEGDESNKFKKMKIKLSSKSTQSEKGLIKDIASKKDFKLNKKLEKNLSTICSKDLVNLVRLMNLVNLKFLKENDNIKFEAVSKTDDVKTELGRIPLGRKIPLTIEEIPSFLKESDTVSQDYAGSGSYF